MTRRIALWIIRASSLLAPRRLRVSWREEWIAEINAPSGTRGRLRTFSRVLGAPIDAFLLRWTTASSDFPARNGWTADFRDAWRALVKTPLQSATMIGCLAVGAALMVSVFAIANTLLAGDLPGIRDRDRLVTFYLLRPNGRQGGASTANLMNVDWGSSPGFESAGAEFSWRFRASVAGTAVDATGSFATGTLFPVLGTVPAAGRLLQPADDDVHADPVVVIGHAFWQRHFSGDPAAIGTSMQIGTRHCVIVGVTPANFAGLRSGDLGETAQDTAQTDLWLPLSLAAGWPGMPPRDKWRGLAGARIVARLAPEATMEGTEAQVQALLPQVRAVYRGDIARILVRPFSLLPSSDPRELGFFLAFLFVIPLIVLAIGAANTAGLHVARVSWRLHELAIRTSLGATRARLARLLAVETLIVSAAAGAIAWLASTWFLARSAAFLPFEASADWRLLVFAIVLPLLLTLTVGVLPAWRATGFDVLSGLRLGGRGGPQGSTRLRRAVVIGQITLSLVLLFTAVVMSRALNKLPQASGDALSRVVVASFYFGEVGLTPDGQRAAVQQVIEQVSNIAPRANVALSNGGLFYPSAVILGPPPPEGSSPFAANYLASRSASPEVFDVLGIRLLQGRLYERGERHVLVVNETFARELAKTGAVLGRSVEITADEWGMSSSKQTMSAMTVIGVVADALERFPMTRDKSFVYLPLQTSGLPYVTAFVRTPQPDLIEQRLAAIASAVHPTVRPKPLATAKALLDDEFRSTVWVAGILGGSGTIAVLLAAVGLFGLISGTVAHRSHEFGVRYALGADRRQVVALVFKDVGRMAAIGLALGLLLALPVSLLVRSAFLANATLLDPGGLAVGIGTLLAAAFGAAWLPARRAGAIDPLVALKGD